MKMSEALYSKTKAEGLGNEIENELKRSAVEVQTLRDETYAAIKKTYEEGGSRKMEKEKEELNKLSKESEYEVNKKIEQIYNEKGLKRGAQNLKGFQSKMVDLTGLSNRLGNKISNMLVTGEQYIGNTYRIRGNGRGSRDCSHFVHALLENAGNKEGYCSSTDFPKRYPQINRDNIRAGDILYQPPTKKYGHVEIIVGKPFTENGHTYIMTIGSSSDKNILDSNGNKMINRDGVGYRKREIFPKNSSKYTFLRPNYESRNSQNS